MSANKYANLPDIDTAPDIYETDDVFPSSTADKDDSSDEETALPTRSAARGRNGEGVAGKEELDSSNLIAAEEASKRFRKAEKKHDKLRSYFAYPPSPTSPISPTGALNLSNPRPVPLSHRLRALQAELSALETELADPSNPLLHKEREEDNVDPGKLIRGLVDVRGRLEKIRRGKEGRGKLVGLVVSESQEGVEEDGLNATGRTREGVRLGGEMRKEEKPDVRNIVDMDKRVSDLEKLVGSSGATLDEVSPLQPPLLPQITRLNTQLTLLTQPRHIDSISRRLKLLLSDLDRASASQQHSHRHHPSHPSPSPPSPSGATETLLPLLTRLAPSLPHIPHILTRLRTLSALHTSAGEFQSTLEGLEKEQHKVREALGGLQDAVKGIEASLEGNRGVVKGNVEGLEERIDVLLRRLEEVGKNYGHRELFPSWVKNKTLSCYERICEQMSTCQERF